MNMKNKSIVYRKCRNVCLYGLSVFFVLAVTPALLNAQLAKSYEVAPWFKFKTSAVSYTFDDNTPKQLTVAKPLFDQYNLKATFFVIPNWNPDWSKLREASLNGFEIASHTVTHASLNQLSIEEQETELQKSQEIIDSYVPEAQCVTIAYPFCRVGNIPTIREHYIAGRVCSGTIEPATPEDFYRISSIVTGAESLIKTATDFNHQVSLSKKAKGWCVCLIHAIDDESGYSPTSSTELAMHLKYVDDNRTDYWVAPFGTIVKYIKERDAVSVSEISLTTDSLQLTVSDHLDDAIYNVPISIRREMPPGWQNARVFINNHVVSSSIVTFATTKFILFDVVPDQADVFLIRKNLKSKGTIN